MIASQVNPYLFTAGGTIRGDYKFKNASVEVSGGGAIELEEEAKLQKKGDDQMSIRFRRTNRGQWGHEHIGDSIGRKHRDRRGLSN